jgi:hypothetical protein
MTDDRRRRRAAAVAAALWCVLAFCVWNVRFDYGVRVGADEFLRSRIHALRLNRPHPIEMADAMRATIAASARGATLMAVPFLLVALWLAVVAWRGRVAS